MHFGMFAQSSNAFISIEDDLYKLIRPQASSQIGIHGPKPQTAGQNQRDKSSLNPWYESVRNVIMVFCFSMLIFYENLLKVFKTVILSILSQFNQFIQRIG